MDGKLPLHSQGIKRLDFSTRGRARGEQTSRDLADLRQSIVAWLQQKRKEDSDLRRHQTQLRAIEGVLLGVAKVLSEHEGSNFDGDISGLYDKYRQLTQAIVWLERLWEFLRSRFDQRRGDSATAKTLRAADEVVWSCYRQVINALSEDHPARQRALMPLAYIEPEYSPAASVFDQAVPPGLRLRSGNPTLDQCLMTVPLPTLRLPPWCVAAPWSLVLVGHEVGHHVEHELGVVDQFANKIAGIAQSGKLDEATEMAWKRWSEEIFADAFSMFAMGPAAAIAITELEWTANHRLAQRKDYYPAPAIRIALMTRVAERVGLDTSNLVPMEELRAIACAQNDTRDDWKMIEPVVDFILSPLPGGLPSLSELCAFNASRFAPRGDLAVWAEALRGIGSLDATRTTESARHMASAAIEAWLAAVADPDETRGSNLLALSSSVPDAISECAEMVVRARAEKEEEIKPATLQAIANLLLGAPAPLSGESG